MEKVVEEGPCVDSVPCDHLKETSTKLSEVIDILEDKDGHKYFCTDTGLSKELKDNQKILIAQVDQASKTQAAFQKSQDRMFSLIEILNEKLESFEDTVRTELKLGHKRMNAIEGYMKEKTLTNGFRDDKTNELKKEVEKKASKDDLEKETKTMEEKIDSLTLSQEKQNKLMEAQIQAQKEFNSMFWKVLTAAFIVFGGIVGVLGLLLRYG